VTGLRDVKQRCCVYLHSIPIGQYCLVGLAIAISSFAAICEQISGMHDFGNRIEGTQVRKNALAELTLVALHRNFARFSSSSCLSVRFFEPPLKGATPVRVSVEAFELRDFHQYYMQSKDEIRWTPNAWNMFEPWPTRDVIDKLSIPSDNLGVLASYSLGPKSVYLPVAVDPGKKEPKETRSNYTFYVLTGIDIKSLSITVERDDGRSVDLSDQHLRFACKPAADPDCSLYPAGGTEAFDVDMSRLKCGFYDVVFRATRPSTSQISVLGIRIYHHD
jgi:hypothetical protein